MPPRLACGRAQATSRRPRVAARRSDRSSTARRSSPGASAPRGRRAAHLGSGRGRQAAGLQWEDRSERAGQPPTGVPARLDTTSKCSSVDAKSNGTATSSTRTSWKPASVASVRSASGSASENSPPGPVGGPPATRPCIMAAMPRLDTHGLCWGPAHTAAVNRPPGRRTRRHSRSACPGSGTNISPMQQTTASNAASSRPVAAASTWAVLACGRSCSVSAARATIPAAASVARTCPPSPTWSASRRASSPEPVASSRTRSPGRSASAATSASATGDVLRWVCARCASQAGASVLQSNVVVIAPPDSATVHLYSIEWRCTRYGWPRQAQL